MIILDLDGVCADFASAACRVHNHPGHIVTKWNFFEDWGGMTPAEFWDPIHDLGNAFYLDMIQPYPWVPKLMEYIREADDFVIMTSPSNHWAGYSGKKLWIDKHLGKGVKTIVGSEKHLLAGQDRLLIDDCEANIQKFRRYGGQTLTFPQLWNQLNGCAEDPIPFVHNSLFFWGKYMKGRLEVA